MATTVMLFDPTAPRQTSEHAGAQVPRLLEGLSGAVVGFIDNAKPNFHYLVDDLADLLIHKHGVRQVITHRKASASIPAKPEVVEELANACDVVIAGSGD